MERKFIVIFLFFVGFAGTGWLMSCGPAPFSLNVYYPLDDSSSPKSRNLETIIFVMNQKSEAAKGSWKDLLRKGELALRLLPCPETPEKIDVGMLPGSLNSLATFVEVLAFSGSVDFDGENKPLKPSWVGRFSLRTACQRSLDGNRKTNVFLAPPSSLMPWGGSNGSGLKDNSWSQRMGHSVTRTSDGRYLIVGGAKELTMNGWVASKWLADWNKDFAVYDPTTGLLEVFEIGVAGAFRSVVWRDNRLFLSGGIGPAKDGGVELQRGVQVLEFLPDEKKWTLRSAKESELGSRNNLEPRSFHTLLRIPSERGEQVSLHTLGGVTSLSAKVPAAKEGLQVLFHSVAGLPVEAGEPGALMTGGFFRREELFHASRGGFLFQVDGGKLKQANPSEQVQAVLSTSRGAHASVALSKERVLVLGGLAGTLGQTPNLQFEDTVELLLRQTTTKGVVWKSTAQCIRKQDDLFRRAFHTMTVVENNDLEVKILVAGGLGAKQQPKPSFLLKWDKRAEKPVCERLDVIVLDGASTPQVFGMHSTTMLETGQIMILGGGLLSFRGGGAIWKAKPVSAWYSPSPRSVVLSSPAAPGQSPSQDPKGAQTTRAARTSHTASAPASE